MSKQSTRAYILGPPRKFNLTDEDYNELLLARVRSAREGREAYRKVASRTRSGLNKMFQAMRYWKTRALNAEFELTQLRAGREVIYLSDRSVGVLGDDGVLELQE